MTETINVDPNTLALEDNVRTTAGLTKQFIANIKENGVLTPIIAVRGEDGKLWVRAGQRRTQAAREAGLETVPVYIVDGGSDTAERLVTQIVENDHRLALRADDRVLGIQALLDVGLSQAKVAKKLSVSPERVKLSKAVAGSQTAMEALRDEHPVTLAEAAAIAEFEDDPDAVDRLRRAAGRNYFDHELSRLRQQRETEAAYTVASAQWREKGFEVLDDMPPSFSTDYVPLWALLEPDGSEADDSVVVEPSHWAVRLTETEVFTDVDTGEPVDESTIDWGTEGDAEATPKEGMRHADSVVETVSWEPSDYYCRDCAATGLTPNERFTKLAGAQAGLDVVQQGKATEAERNERRKVVTLNKAGAAAQEVRREFVRNLLARKTPPKGAAMFVARMLASDGYLLSNTKADEAVTDLLALKDGLRSEIDVMVRSGDARAQVITLGLVLAALEARTPKQAWRGASASTGVGPKDYLGFLAENGYTLSVVEHVMVGAKTADECFEELTHE